MALDEAGLTFDGCANLVRNLRLLGVDTLDLLKLSDELTGKGLTAKSIRSNIDLNDELKAKGITVEIQKEILAAAKSYGDPQSILGMVNASGGLDQLASEQSKMRQDLAEAKSEKEQVMREKERLETESLVYKSYIDIVRLLVKKYSFDLSSINELLSLAEKYGNPIQIIRAVNVHHGMLDLQAKLREVQTRLHTTEEDLADKEATLKVKEENLAKANQLLGEIRANQAQSLRLQIVSDLIMKPKGVKATVNELARICLIVLIGVKEYTEYNIQESDKFRSKVGPRLNWVIQDLQEYLG